MTDAAFDVVVVGAGPSGLWLACELRLAGLNVCVVERREGRVTQSRSLTIHGRTLEMFALRGLEKRFLEVGRPIPSWHFAGLRTRLDFSCFESRHPYLLFLPQTMTESLLHTRALELGVKILQAHTVSQILVTAGSTPNCLLECTGPTSVLRLEACFIVGADGARSIVRKQANIAFPGQDATHSVMMADAQVDLPGGEPVMSMENAAGGLTIMPLGNGTQRIIRLDPTLSHVDARTPLSEIELRESLTRIAGSDLSLRNVTWLSRFTDETRLAESYRRGPIFLIGDAAHVHAPMGGQGLNVGLQDAMNLGWKLAAVVKGEAPQSLLDTYEIERRPVGFRLFKNTLAQVALASRFDAASLTLRETVSEFLTNKTLNRSLAGELSGFDLTYQTKLPGCGEGDAGTRVPDADLEHLNGHQSSVYESLSTGQWLHLSLVEGAIVDRPSWLPNAQVVNIKATGSLCGTVYQRSAAMLVRPDGYIASSVPRTQTVPHA